MIFWCYFFGKAGPVVLMLWQSRSSHVALPSNFGLLIKILGGKGYLLLSDLVYPEQKLLKLVLQ